VWSKEASGASVVVERYIYTAGSVYTTNELAVVETRE
jgi:hypothetical protein